MNAYEKAFRRHLEIGHYSPSTIKTYLSQFRKCQRYLGGHPKDWSTEQLCDYFHYLVKACQYSVSSLNQSMNALKFLFEKILNRDWPVAKLPRPRKVKRLPQVISEDEVWQLIRDPGNIKHRVILEVLYTSGVRLKELLNLKVTDVDSSRMQLRIREGKGRKDRYSLLAKSTLIQLRIYWRRYRPQEWLFESFEPGQPYSRSSVQKIFKRAKVNVGIKKPFSIHGLRHCFATHMLDKGVPIHKLKHYLGHQSLQTTAIYLHLQSDSLQGTPHPFDEV